MGMNGMCLTATLSSVSQAAIFGGSLALPHSSTFLIDLLLLLQLLLSDYSDFTIFLINRLLNYFFFLIGSTTGTNCSSCNQGVDNSSFSLETLKELMTQYYYLQMFFMNKLICL